MTPLVQFALVVATFGVNSQAQSTLLSPPLYVLAGRRLSLELPAGYHVVSQEPTARWKTSSYQFQIAPQHGAGRVTVEVLMHALSRARRHGDLEGDPFRTAAGLQGVLTSSPTGMRPSSRYFAVPVISTDSAVILRVFASQGDASIPREFAERLFQGVRFVDARRPNQTLQLTADRCVTTLKFNERVLDRSKARFH
jgi:hypothetical protein